VGRCRERRHAGGTLVATQDGAQGYHQQLMPIMNTGIAGPRILQSFKAGDKLIQCGRRSLPTEGRIHAIRIGQAPMRVSREFQMRFPRGQASKFLNPALQAVYPSRVGDFRGILRDGRG
jgi:hypothetical protein